MELSVTDRVETTSILEITDEEKKVERLLQETDIITRSAALICLKYQLLELTMFKKLLSNPNVKTNSASLGKTHRCIEHCSQAIIKYSTLLPPKLLEEGIGSSRIDGINTKWTGLDMTFYSDSGKKGEHATVLQLEEIDTFVHSQETKLTEETSKDPSLRPFVVKGELWGYRLGESDPRENLHSKILQ